MKRRFHLLASLALTAFCLFSCERINNEGVPGGGNNAWKSQASKEKLAGTTYQLNVYSFADSDGDGWGDLRGVTQHLDYFDSLGVTALLLSPIFQAMSYHGYDVTDYSAINPWFGSEANFQDLVDKAKARGIDIYMDYVLNHSSDQNPWFRQACAEPNGPYRDYYVFSDDPDSDMRNGKVDNFGGATYTRMGTWHELSDGSYYFASFDKSMPDLNYGPFDKAAESPAFKDLAAAAGKWIDLGVNGLRLDAVNWIYQEQIAANVAFLKAWYERCNAAYKARGEQGNFYMVGDARSDNVEQMAPYYQGLPSNFNFYFWYTLKDCINRGRGDEFARTVQSFRILFLQNRRDFIDAIKLTNHDEDRVAEDLGRDVAKEKLAAAVLLTSPGKPFIYQGEELGYWGRKDRGDEFVRTPIKWTRGGSVASAALSGKVDHAMLSEEISVEAQEQNNASVLRVYRDFAQARSAWKALALGEIEAVASPNSAVAVWRMKYEGQAVLVIHNFSGGSPVLPLPEYKTDRLIVSNGTVTVSDASVTLGAYASAVFLQ